MSPHATLLTALCGCFGTEMASPAFSLESEQHDPRRLTIVTESTQGTTYWVKLAYQLTGGPDSAITSVRQGTSRVEHRLPRVTRDSFALARPSAGVTASGMGCVQSKRRGSSDPWELSNEVCAGWSYTEPAVDQPPPDPVIDSVRTDTTVTQPPPSGGVFYQNDFSSGLNGLSVWNTWPSGWSPPSIVNGALSMTWGPAGDNNNRGAVYHFSARQVVHVRFRYRLPNAANITGIMKLIRFRGPNDYGVGTLNIQWSQFNLGFDAFGGSNNFGGDPNDCKTADCWVEVSWEGQPPGAARQRLWINGVLRIDATKTGIAYSGGVQSVYLWGYFNTPSDARTETMDDLTFSTGYIGGIS